MVYDGFWVAVDESSHCKGKKWPAKPHTVRLLSPECGKRLTEKKGYVQCQIALSLLKVEIDLRFFPVRQEMKSKDLWGKQNALLFKRFHRTHFWEHPFLLEHTGANVGKSAAQKEWYENQFPSSLSPGPLTHGVKFTRRAISSYVLWSRKETQMHVWDIFPCQVKVLFPC